MTDEQRAQSIPQWVNQTQPCTHKDDTERLRAALRVALEGRCHWGSEHGMTYCEAHNAEWPQDNDGCEWKREARAILAETDD